MADVETEMAHVRSLPSDYSDVQDRSYDPNFISDISKKMQVPERICLDDGSGAAEHSIYYDPGSGRQFSAMTVPDRIIVAGDNQHIGMREGLRKLPIDRDPHTEVVPNMVELTTPPRVLTLEQRFPFVDDSDEKQNRESQDRQLSANGHIGAPIPYTPGMNPNDSLLLNEEDEATLLRTHVAKLTRRITAVEQDSMRRSQREMGLYIALFGYAIWKFVFSFFKSR
ncbi:mitochondrial fission factor-like [Littorina saxatilis]|uniref:Mitochondrial fission factor n=1 Tax=Littorina saxatilis TaxID=31220 RepID=A0AAN9ARF4_9CAEN